MSLKQKNLFNTIKQSHQLINQPQSNSINIPKSLDTEQLQRDSMLILRGSINKTLRSNPNWEVKFLKAIKREIYFKKGGPVVALVRDALI